MEIVVRTTDFARVLRLVQSLADRKNTVPVLSFTCYCHTVPRRLASRI